MKKTVFAMLLALLMAASASADVVYDEADSGDLSSDNLAPTFVTLSDTGSNVSKVLASTTFSPLDRDFLTITVADGYELTEIIWGLYDTTEDQSFFAIEAGTTVSDINGTGLLGATFVDANDVANDVLQKLGAADLAGTGFSGALPSGDYTFWFQETTADVDYGFTFVVSRAVPEPSMGFIPAVLGLACLARRKR